jgi:hypothetical protein
VPQGAERNQLRQIAVSLGTLFNNKKWRQAHAREGSLPVPTMSALSRPQ